MSARSNDLPGPDHGKTPTTDISAAATNTPNGTAPNDTAPNASAGTPATPHDEITGGRGSHWASLWVLMIGFFMILLDATIVAVAMPSITDSFNADVNQVVWVTSSYLFAFAVPLLITGRLGDRFGPKNLYILGLLLFTLASFACGLSSSIGALIAFRAIQGFGGSLLTPQTMAIIIRIFPPTDRGAALGIWGAVAGLATVVGPLLGGLLTDFAGWEWVFEVNVPIGIIGLVLAFIFIPKLSVFAHSFDWLGVVLSAIGMFGLVYGIQQGQSMNWDWRPFTLIGLGILFLIAFVVWQEKIKGEPLVPLKLFRDRNFSLALFAITCVGFAINVFAMPLMLYIQLVQHYSPTEAGLIMLPTGIISGLISVYVGRMLNHRDPKYFSVSGLLISGIGIALINLFAHPDFNPLWMLVPAVVLGIGNGLMWGPLSTIATRNLDFTLAGAGSSVFNTVRQIGAVIGSASIAAVMTGQIAIQLGDQSSESASPFNVGQLPPQAFDGFSTAMGNSELLPAAVLVVAAIATLWFAPTKAWHH